MVVIVSVNVRLPPAPVAVHTQVEGYPTQLKLAGPVALPFTGETVPPPEYPVPVEVQLNETEVALVVLQVTV